MQVVETHFLFTQTFVEDDKKRELRLHYMEQNNRRNHNISFTIPYIQPN